MQTASRIALALFVVGSGTHGQNQVLYQSDFESDDGGALVTAGNDWEHGVPTAGPASAHSGSKCWGTNLDGEPTGADDVLDLPLLDASGIPHVDAVVVRWWQYIDDPTSPVAWHRAVVSASTAEGHNQHVFGHQHFDWSTDLPHTGWREQAIVLGPEYLSASLRIWFHFEGSATDGWYVDDVTVTAIQTHDLYLDDFEAGSGGFTGDWTHGSLQFGCPFPIDAPSGDFVWHTGPCSYYDTQTMTSPVLDIGGYQNLDGLYATWRRYALFEYIRDGMHHEVRYDDGPWEIGAGYHTSALGPGLFLHTGYGVAIDPTRGDTVQLRWRISTDMLETEYGSWLDDFRLVTIDPLQGLGANPPDSLVVQSGSFSIGDTLVLGITDPSATFGPIGVPVLAVALNGAPTLPAPIPVPGGGMTPGTDGDLLIDVGSIAVIENGTPWIPGTPAQVTLPIPSQPSIVGAKVFLQGLLFDPALTDFGLTNGLFGVLTN